MRRDSLVKVYLCGLDSPSLTRVNYRIQLLLHGCGDADKVVADWLRGGLLLLGIVAIGTDGWRQPRGERASPP